MARVRIAGHRFGEFRKVSHTKLIRERTGLSLSQAKEFNDRVYLGESVVVELPTLEAAEEFVTESRKLGAMAEVERNVSLSEASGSS